ncbi:UDP-glucose:(heptosyl)LPS alpha-1,3-glucosyltransferase [Halanaerobium sp. DL-01]|uniref:glycosyltransferase family 4 protein n=1 Tax=Halanaerobium sp. DL-01 TaxID=1653064 RepID=UPI000DF4C8BC|nr:glycosyltransferase family 4 protein [Halanaerobium sp. DL-01]RCW83289.1 UDP-glucose:(heptosyl)LPS alpha-1,3-glucosyltransferase [Halanaerobium sp. DL-01]
MKIALVHKKYTTHGGTERYMVGLSKYLIRKGHEVHVFTAKIDSETKKDNIIFHRIPGWGKHIGIDKYIFAKNAFQSVKKYDFDIVQTFSRVGFGDVIRIGGGCHKIFLDKYLRSIDSTMYKLKKKIEYKLSLNDYFTRYFEKKDFQKGNYKKIVAVSQMVKEEIVDNYDIPEEDIIVNHNGVNIDKFHPDNKKKYSEIIRKKYGISPRDYLILFLGTGFQRKGLKYVIEALKGLGKGKLMVVGKGKIDRFKKMAEDFSISDRIVFTGPVREVEKYYASADIFVFPSIYDPCANVTLEAMASGLPTITTKSNGASGVIKHGENGYILDSPDDIINIKNYISNLDNTALREKMAEKARKSMLNNSKKDNYEKMITIYKSII